MEFFGKRRKGIQFFIFIPLFLLIALINGCTGESKQKEKYRIGILSGLQCFNRTIDGLKAGMSKFGFVEGETIIYQIAKAYANPELQRKSLEKMVADKVDLILVYPTEASLLAKQIAKGTGIPVVFTNAALEGNALVDNVRQPGGNITGVRYPGPESLLKRLEFLQQLIPETKRVLIFYDPDYPNNQPALELLRPASVSFGITLIEIQATNPETIEAEIKKRTDSADIDVDAILMMPEIVSTGPVSWEAIRTFGYRYKIPILGGVMVPGKQGCLLSYSPDAYHVGEAAAQLVDKILKGIPAGTIPVVSPDSYLHLNYKQARYFGINIPEGILAQAVEIVR